MRHLAVPPSVPAFEVISLHTCCFPFPQHSPPVQWLKHLTKGPSCSGRVAGGTILAALGFASCRDESSISASHCCSGTTNIPSLGQGDVPSPEPLMPAKESQG